MSLNPALVTQRGVRRLPRVALLLLCAAYVLPGVFARDPWRNADLVAYAQMAALAEGRSGWWQPLLGAVPGDTALLPHWLGAAFILLLEPTGLPSEVAARLPFVALLALTLSAVWYTTYYLARTEAAQPVAFAFGGEAEPVPYARAMADGALLALIASLGLLQLGHETTPELVQLFAVALFMLGLAFGPFKPRLSRAACLVALPLLAGSGAPTMAMASGLAGWLVCHRSRYPVVRQGAVWLLLALVLAAAVGAALGAWRWRTVPPDTAADLLGWLRQWAWFMWPAWPLALWTLWQWRGRWSRRHLSVPATTVLVALVANIAMNGSDRALLLALPGLAVLAAFALPTLKRSTAAAIDWFSMFFFSLAALSIWVIYAAMQTGVPAKTAANVARLLPGYLHSFNLAETLLALLATGAWLWLVRWRTGRHREALWKSLVLPAGGVALCWLLLMTLWLPALDYARSSRALVAKVGEHWTPGACVWAPDARPVLVAGLEVFGRYRVDARPQPAAPACTNRVALHRGARTALPADPPGWTLQAALNRPTERHEWVLLYQPAAPVAAASP
ncbi:MAG: hypothetical protein ACK5QH_05520 [Rubrivivax sp.]